MTADPAPVSPLTRPLQLVVHGTPATQGHKTAHAHGGHTWVSDSNAEQLRPWRALVTAAAAQARGEVLVGPVAIKVIFTLKRPVGLPARHRGPDGVLRPYRPLPAKRPDLDTLCRAVLDALSDAGVWRDDGQVVELRAAKLYVGDDDALDAPGARIEVHLVAESALDAPGPSAEALLQAAEAR